MDWTQIVFIMLGNAGIWIPMIIWLRGSQDDDRREIMAILNAIQTEMKDFHARLCVIEERRK